MFRLITFGGLAVERDAGSDNAVRARLAILAVLAASGARGIRRDKLLSIFWPESDEERARNALRQALFKLSRDFSEAYVIEGTADLRLNQQAITSDVSDFTTFLQAGRLEDAVALYRGPFLDGVHIRNAPEFERWAEDSRRSLSLSYGKALETLAEAATVKGDLRAAVHWWQQRAAHDPLSSRIALMYMRSLVALGDPESAIRHSSVHAALVRSELGADPSVDVLQLAMDLQVPGIVTGLPRLNGAAAVRPLPEPGLTNGDPHSAQVATPLPLLSRVVWRRVGVAAAGVLAATSILVNLARSGEPEVRLYAVAPLQNHTGDTTLSTLGAMVTAQVTQQLALNVGVDVIDLRRVASGDTTGSGATGQARDVGAGLVIAGDIYAKGDSIVVQMQLLNAVNGRVVHQFDPVVALRPSLAGIVERIRDAVGGAVATLGDSLYQPWSRAHSKPPSHAAFVEFIQALQIFSRQDARLMPDVLAHMRRATELDTTFIAAKIWMMEWVDDDVSLRAYRDSLAAAAARQRPSLSPFDRASLDRRLARNRGDWEGAYAASKRMLSAAPHTQDAQVQVVNAAMATRRYAEAIRVAEQVDHRSGWLSDHAQLVEWEIQAFHVLGDVPSAIAVWRRARLKDPEDYFLCLSGVRLHAALGLEATADSMISVCAALEGAPKHREEWEPAGIEFSVHGHAEAAARALGRMLDFYRAENRLARVSDVAARMGNWELAYQAATSLRMDSTNVEGRTRLAVAAAHVGDTATVKATLRLIENWGRQASRRGRDKALHAFIVLAQGDKGTAIDLLRQAVSEGVAPGYQAWYHRHELVPFHGDPRFEALIRGR